MPFDGSGNFSLVAGYLAVNGATIATTNHNPPLEDIASALTACIKANGAKAMSAALTLSGDPSADNHAARKAYVDAQALAALTTLKIKPSCLCVTTGNISLTGEQTLDGQLTSASRVLVVNQNAPAENGIYVTGAGAWARATDFDAWSTEIPGAIVSVEAGTIFADTLWQCSADAGGTLNTTAITWRRIDNQWRRNAQTGTTYTVVKDDHNFYVTHSNGSAIATTLPQATGNFGKGFGYISQNLGAGANTITPTTSTINGAATLVQRTGDAHFIHSDGTNYRAIPLGMTYEQVTGLTVDGTGAVGDYIVTEDVSATGLRKMLLSVLQTLFAASQAQMEAASSNAVDVTPGRMQFHPGVLKAYTSVDAISGATPVIGRSYGVTSVGDDGAGRIQVNFSITWSDALYIPMAFTYGTGVVQSVPSGLNSDTRSTTTFDFRTIRPSSEVAQDSDGTGIGFAGDLP